MCRRCLRPLATSSNVTSSPPASCRRGKFSLNSRCRPQPLRPAKSAAGPAHVAAAPRSFARKTATTASPAAIRAARRHLFHMRYSNRLFLYAPFAVLLIIAAAAMLRWREVADELQTKLLAANRGEEIAQGVSHH